MKMQVLAGATSQSILVFIQDSSSTTGGGKTGLAYNTSSLVCYYAKPGANSVSVSLATQTVTGAFSSGGFVEVDSTNMPGIYRLDIPDAAISAVGTVVFMLKGASGMAPLPLEIQCVAYNPADSVRLGLTALPNAAAAANGGLPTVDANNSVKTQTGPKKNAALSNFAFLMLDGSGNPTTGLTVTAKRSIDGAAFADCANSVTELSNGWYLINLAAGDLNGNVINFKASATGARDADITFFTNP